MPVKKKTTTRRSTAPVAPRRKNIKGKGDYTYDAPGPWGKMGQRMGEAVGGIGGGAFGKPGAEAGRFVGKKLGGLAHYIGRLFGSGDYKIGTPPATNSLFQGSGKLPYDPTISFGEKRIRIKHREYIGDVITSANPNSFKEKNYAVNPGLFATFPWLSTVAPAFQFYKWHGMVVEFKTTSADALNSTNTALGTVIMATDYNASTFAQSFVSKQEMLNYEGAIDCKPSDSALMGIECDPKKLPISELYVRTGTLPSDQDIRMNDMCSFSVATKGFQAASVNIGELFIAYDIELFSPVQLPPGALSLAAQYTFDLASMGLQQTNVGTSGIFGNARLAAKAFDNMEIVFGYGTTLPNALIGVKSKSTIPSGSSWILEWTCVGAATSSLGRPNVSAATGVTYISSNRYIGGPDVSSTDDISNLSYHFTVPDSSLLVPSFAANWWVDGQAIPSSDNDQIYIIASITNTGVPTATRTVPDNPTVALMRLFQINPCMVGSSITIV